MKESPYNAALLIAQAQKLPFCVVCGADKGEPCKYLSSGDNHNIGDLRPTPHFYR